MRATFGAFILVAATAGCLPLAPGVVGSGNVKEETREVVADFSGIEVGNTVSADVTLGDTPSLRLSADDNLLPRFETKVEAGRLVIRFQDERGYRTKNPVKATIVARKVDSLGARGASQVVAKVGETDSFAIESTGASRVDVSGVATQKLTAMASGASQVKAAGKSREAKLDASGASRIDTRGLAAETVSTHLSGASHAEVQATKSVGGDVSGASSLDVAGKPAQRSVGTSGASHVRYE